MARRLAVSLLERHLLNARGEVETVGTIVAQMQRDGVAQALIDRWLQGLTRGNQ